MGCKKTFREWLLTANKFPDRVLLNKSIGHRYKLIDETVFIKLKGNHSWSTLSPVKTPIKARGDGYQVVNDQSFDFKLAILVLDQFTETFYFEAPWKNNTRIYLEIEDETVKLTWKNFTLQWDLSGVHRKYLEPNFNTFLSMCVNIFNRPFKYKEYQDGKIENQHQTSEDREDRDNGEDY